MHSAKTLKLRFCVEDLDLPDRRASYTSSRVEEEEGAQSCPCGEADESQTHMVGDVQYTRRKGVC